jgi:glycosyltransferase involved in cell wall biosynthesis
VARRPYLFDARSASWKRTTGWERYVREIAGRLERTDHDVEIHRGGGERLHSRLYQDWVSVPRAARSRRVVHFPSFPPVPWVGRTSRVVLTLHDLTWWKLPETASSLGRSYYAPLAHVAVRRGAHLVTATNAVADELRDHFQIGGDRITVVPLGTALPVPSAPMRRPRPYVLFVGTQEPRKNLHLLSEAYRSSGLASTHDLLVVGRPGWGVQVPGAEVLSDLDDERLAAAYAGATALVMPSLYEGFGLPVVEAICAKVPVICSDLPVLREVSGGHATFVDPADVDALAAALLASPNMSAPPGADSWARSQWDWGAAAATLSALYRRLS